MRDEILSTKHYKLSQDVINPRSDGRSKYDILKVKVWKKGMPVDLVEKKWTNGDVFFIQTSVEIVGRYQRAVLDPRQREAILAHIVPDFDLMRELREAYPWSWEKAVLTELVNTGKIPKEDIVHAIEALDTGEGT